MRQSIGSLRPSETTLAIQTQIEGLGHQQVLARDLLVLNGFMLHASATTFVTALGPEKSAGLKETLQTHGILKEDIERFLAQSVQVSA